MTLQGKHSRPNSESPVEQKTKQHRPDAGPSECSASKDIDDAKPEPSQREIDAAVAARARLYGGGTRDDELEAAAAAVARLPTGPEPAAVGEMEYTPTDRLDPVENSAEDMQLALRNMQSAQWTTACSGLVLLRRITVHHQEEAWRHIERVVPLVQKAVKSLRSLLCKTAIMAAADLVQSFGDRLLPHLDIRGASSPSDSLLSQMLLKGSSNDKRFVIEEAQRALQVTAASISAVQLLGRLLPYANHKNPKVRGTAATVIAASAQRLQGEDWTLVGTEDLLKLAGSLVSDNTPEARSAARTLIMLLRGVYTKQVEEKENAQSSPVNSPRDPNGLSAREGNCQPAATWEAQCKACLGSAQAAAVLKVV